MHMVNANNVLNKIDFLTILFLKMLFHSILFIDYSDYIPLIFNNHKVLEAYLDFNNNIIIDMLMDIKSDYCFRICFAANFNVIETIKNNANYIVQNDWVIISKNIRIGKSKSLYGIFNIIMENICKNKSILDELNRNLTNTNYWSTYNIFHDYVTLRAIPKGNIQETDIDNVKGRLNYIKKYIRSDIDNIINRHNNKYKFHLEW